MYKCIHTHPYITDKHINTINIHIQCISAGFSPSHTVCVATWHTPFRKTFNFKTCSKSRQAKQRSSHVSFATWDSILTGNFLSILRKSMLIFQHHDLFTFYITFWQQILTKKWEITLTSNVLRISFSVRLNVFFTNIMPALFTYNVCNYKHQKLLHIFLP